jgi:serine/threonine protein kinase/Tfp pilus assembly protein PilF
MSKNNPNVKVIFAAALEFESPAERNAYLAGVCGDDAGLCQEVESLLTAHGQADGFLSRAVPKMHPTLPLPARPETPGTQIGSYKIREQLAEGGMGVVYVAEQQEPVRRKVALKIIKPGMATKDVMARFDVERQALAMMDHPNIARIFDGGATDTGQPFFVMELVRGIPITEYCDRERLATADRLQLFLKVCRAVQHAHQKGIIHRDIKPSNVLTPKIDGEAVPKVIDFGVAKAVSQKLTDETVYTQFAQVIGTPLYMSPEQAGTGVVDIDTRSDIYSLGVLLYELLTGNTPFDREILKESGWGEFRRILREEEPRRPSDAISTLNAGALSTISKRRDAEPRKLTQTLRGELDWIVMKTLEKDRTRRYETANGLARDIERYLNSESVEACPPSAVYRFKKFARRNRGRLSLGTLVATLLLFAFIYAVNAKSQRDSSRRQVILAVEQSMAAARGAIETDDLALARQNMALAEERLANADTQLPQLVTSVEQLSIEVAKRSEQQQRFQRYEQQTHDGMDDILYDKGLDGQGVALQALDLYGVLSDVHWLDRLQASYISTPQQNAVRQTAYEVLLVLADYGVRWPDKRTEQTAQDSLRFLQVAVTFHEPTRAFYWVRSECHKFLKNDQQAQQDLTLFRTTAATTAFDYYLPGHTAGWRGDLKEATRSYRAALRMRPDHFNSLFFLAMRLSADGHKAEAAEIYRACLALRQDHTPTLRNRAVLLAGTGEFEEALELVDRAIELNDTSPVGFAARGSIFVAAHQYEKALADFDEALRLAELDTSSNTATTMNVYDHRADMFYRKGQNDKALEDLNAAVELARKATGPIPAGNRFHVLRNRGVILVEKEDYAEALTDIDESLRLAANKNAKLSSDTVALAHSTRGKIFVCTQRYDEALTECDKALALASESNTDLVIETRCFRASALKDLGRFNESVREFNRTIELVPKKGTAPWYWAHNALAWLLVTCPDSSLQDTPRAIELAGKAVKFAADNGAYWNTLGVAQYRGGNWTSAITSLEKSLELGDTGKVCNGLFLAMANWQLGKHEEARHWYREAVAWMKQEEQHDEDLKRFFAEATETLGIEVDR